MKKVKIKVSAGIKFLSHWKELWTYLPENEHYILNKTICGCDATEAYIRSKKKNSPVQGNIFLSTSTYNMKNTIVMD